MTCGNCYQTDHKILEQVKTFYTIACHRPKVLKWHKSEVSSIFGSKLCIHILAYFCNLLIQNEELNLF